MMIKNKTTFPHLVFGNSNPDGSQYGVALIKCAFDLDQNGRAHISKEQEPINFVDQCYEDFNSSSLKSPSDFVAFKPSTDFIFNAQTRAPKTGLNQWLAGVKITDPSGMNIEKILRIHGKRYWIPQWPQNYGFNDQPYSGDHKDFRGWKLSDAEPIERLPIRYEYAYGGMLSRGIDAEGIAIQEAYEQNPLGCGWINKVRTDHRFPIIAPQIEDAYIPINDPYQQYSPSGLGAIPPAWLPRRPLGGTYDQNWIDHKHPHWPDDYDLKYNNSAAAGLHDHDYVESRFSIELAHLYPNKAIHNIQVEAPVIGVFNMGDRFELFFPPIDTVYLNIEDDQSFEHRLSVCWRFPFKKSEDAEFMIFATTEAQKSELMQDDEVEISPSPQPRDFSFANIKVEPSL